MKKKIKAPLVTNGLTDAILGAAAIQGAALSQLDTLRTSLRFALLSNDKIALSQGYVENGLIQSLVDVPVDDALRGGFDITTKQLDEDEIEELQATMEDEGDITVLGYGGKWTRLFGGGAIIIRTDQDPMKPLKDDELEQSSRIGFQDADLWELYSQNQLMAANETAILPKEMTHYHYNNTKVHKSRVMILQGRRAPSYIRQQLRGWGMSEVEHLIRSFNQYVKATNLTFEVLDEFKIDIYKIKNLNSNLMTPDGENLVKMRIALANFQKNYQNAIVMDSEDAYDQKELSFSGIAETMAGIRMQVASEIRIPLSKLFGIGSQGFSSGEDDLENYNAMVEGTIRPKLKRHLTRMVKIRCQQLHGLIPDDLRIKFKPLRMLSSEQEEAVKSTKFDRADRAYARGILTAKEFKETCNRDNLLGVKIEENDEVSLPEPSPDGGEGLPAVSQPKETKRKAPKAKEAE
jgi:phage-related protein (TIGR01555 family)